VIDEIKKGRKWSSLVSSLRSLKKVRKRDKASRREREREKWMEDKARLME
jgi:hypothetical protein